jgi:hypothetical protein
LNLRVHQQLRNVAAAALAAAAFLSATGHNFLPR